MSLDGYLDDTSNTRLILSDEEDFDRVDQERADCEAILIGANAVRKDNPRLTIKSEERIKAREKKGLPPNLIKVTLTSTGNLSPDLKFFTHGNLTKIVYCTKNVYKELDLKLKGVAEVIPFPDLAIDPFFILEDLFAKGIKKLIVEGGCKTLTMFLSNDIVDEIQISVAPFFVGDANAPRLVNPCNFHYNKNNRMHLQSVEKVGDMALITYLLINNT
jgi:5-amino-6-(5-phosphoribosylamino)uracil reductase